MDRQALSKIKMSYDVSFASEKLTLEKKQNHHGFVIKEKAKLFPSKGE